MNKVETLERAVERLSYAVLDLRDYTMKAGTGVRFGSERIVSAMLGNIEELKPELVKRWIEVEELLALKESATTEQKETR